MAFNAVKVWSLNRSKGHEKLDDAACGHGHGHLGCLGAAFLLVMTGIEKVHLTQRGPPRTTAWLGRFDGG